MELSDTLRRGARNAGWGAGEYLILPLLYLVTTPFLVSGLGTAEYGVWMLTNAIVGFTGMVGFGLGDATVRFVSQSKGRGDVAAASSIVRTTLAWYLVLGCAAGVLVYTLTPTLVHSVFRIEPDGTETAEAALRISAVAIFLRLIESALTATIHGFERYDVAAKIGIPVQIAGVIAAVVIVLTGGGVVGIVAVGAVITAVSVFARFVIVKRLFFPSFSLVPGFDTPLTRSLLSYGVFTWVQGGGSILLGQVDRLLVASLAGTTSLTYYAVCVSVAQQIHAVLARGAAVLLPMTSSSAERGDTGTIRQLYFQSMNVVVVSALLLAIPLFLLSHPFLSLWMSPLFADKASGVLELLTLTFALLATSIVPHYIMNATSFYRLNTILGLSSGALSTLLAFLLISPLGIAGAALSRLLTLPVSLAGRRAVHRKVLLDGRPHGPFIVFVPVLATFAILAGLKWGTALHMAGFPETVIAALIAMAILAPASWFFLREFNSERSLTDAGSISRLHAHESGAHNDH